jgi:hypothetical protein
MSCPIIIYLDLNYLSNMAKARLGHLAPVHDPDCWLQLYEELLEGVRRGRLTCPALEFQIEEASFDTRLVAEITRIVAELSGGLQFVSHGGMLRSGVLDAALRFLGKPGLEGPDWARAFSTDPKTPTTERARHSPQDAPTDTALTSDPELVLEKRKAKEQWVATARERYEDYSCQRWEEAVRREKLAYIDGILGTCGQEDEGKSEGTLQAMLQELGMGVAEIERFRTCRELADVPTIDIECLIRTAAVRYSKYRRQLGSDLRDARILACALPNCDIVTTDRFMRQIVVQHLRLNKKYGCEVFSARKHDRLAFQRRLQDAVGGRGE